MKTTQKLLAILITFATVLILSSCTQKTAEEETISSEEEITTVTEEELSDQSSQPTIDAPLITIDELLQLTESDDNIIIVDVRSKEDYQISHIKGAISVPEYMIKAGEWDPPGGKVLILY